MYKHKNNLLKFKKLKKMSSDIFAGQTWWYVANNLGRPLGMVNKYKSKGQIYE